MKTNKIIVGLLLAISANVSFADPVTIVNQTSQPINASDRAGQVSIQANSSGSLDYNELFGSDWIYIYAQDKTKICNCNFSNDPGSAYPTMNITVTPSTSVNSKPCTPSVPNGGINGICF